MARFDARYRRFKDAAVSAVESELMVIIVGRAAVPAIDAWASASTLTDE